jgi:hypothetical protein
MSINILVNDDFTNFSVGNKQGEAEFFYFTAGSFIGNNGTFASSSSGTTIGSVPFSLTVNNDLDHVKWLAYRSQTFTLPDNGELIAETTLSGRCVGVDCNPFPVSLVPNPQSDYRLSAYGPSNIDFTHLMTSDFFITNEVIYALYEILPDNKPSYGGPGPDYASFSSLIPVGGKEDYDPATGTVTVGTAYNKACGYIRFLVNGEERYRTPRVGHYPDPQYISINHGGPETDIVMETVNLGYGIFTLLDGALIGSNCCRPGLIALDKPDLYYNPCAVPCLPQFQGQKQTFYNTTDPASLRLWGQGAYMNLKKQVIYTVTC